MPTPPSVGGSWEVENYTFCEKYVPHGSERVASWKLAHRSSVILCKINYIFADYFLVSFFNHFESGVRVCL